MIIKPWETIKNIFWGALEPLFPTLRDIWIWCGFMTPPPRQNFHYGYVKKDIRISDVRELLNKNGFSHDYIAWVDPGEVLNMRKVVDIIFQYHVRLFNDGEVRAHHEYTGESHCFKHLFEKGMTKGEDYLYPLLKDVLDETISPEAKFDPKSRLLRF